MKTIIDGWGLHIPIDKIIIRYNKQTKRLECVYHGKNLIGFSSPYSIPFLELTFLNENELTEFKENFKNEYNKQKRLQPEMWKKQKSLGIKNINYHKKHWSTDFNKPIVNDWLSFINPFLRKRK